MIITKNKPFTKDEIQKLAERFSQEALKRKDEIDTQSIPAYLVNLLGEVEKLKKLKDGIEKAEKALLLSTLFQNAAISSKTQN